MQRVPISLFPGVFLPSMFVTDLCPATCPQTGHVWKVPQATHRIMTMLVLSSFQHEVEKHLS